MVALAVALLLAEAGLRIAGFEFTLAPDLVVLGEPVPARYRADPQLFWVPRDYTARLAALAGSAPDVLFLGDSCTELGSWPREFGRRLRVAHPGTDIRVEKLGVSGWSSFQGLRQLERDVPALEPRVVGIGFGWNDHWDGYGFEDARAEEVLDTPLARLDFLRTLQLVQKARLARRFSGDGPRPKRVAPEDFRRNLTEMTRRVRALGAVPLLLTAPSAHVRGAEPEYLRGRFIQDLDTLVPVHEQYVEIVREVAAATATPLCDLAARPEFAGSAPGSFQTDGIHLTDAGSRRVAQVLSECFEREPELAALW